MNVGLWIAPAVLVGLLVILWIASGLERFVTPPSFVPPIQRAADADHTQAAARPEVDDVAPQIAGGLGSTPT